MSYLKIQYGTDRVPKTSYPEKLIARLVKEMHIVPGKMAELGCGRGDFAEAWIKAGFTLIGIDREVGSKNFDVLKVDISKERLPLSSGAYGLIFHKSLLEHLSDPDNMMRESYRVLERHGKLCIMCPDWRTYMKTFYDDYTHVRPYDKVSLKDLMEHYGFEDVTVKVIAQYPAAWNSRLVRAAMWVTRQVLPVELALWLSEKTGIQFFKWSCQLTLLGIGYKRSAL